MARLQMSHDYSGDPEAVSSLLQGQVRGTVLAAGDLDEDGTADVVAGYSRPGGGVVVIYYGNRTAIDPDQAGRQRLLRGLPAAEPFRPEAKVVALPAAPDFVAIGDFDGDGHLDVLAAEKGSDRLCLLAGDGNGGLAEIRSREVEGRITALTHGNIQRRNGREDLAVALDSDSEARLALYQSRSGAWSARPEFHPLPEPATRLIFDRIRRDGTKALAVAGENIVALFWESAGRQEEPSGSTSDRALLQRQEFILPFEIVSAAAVRSGESGARGLIVWSDAGASQLIRAEGPGPGAFSMESLPGYPLRGVTSLAVAQLSTAAEDLVFLGKDQVWTGGPPLRERPDAVAAAESSRGILLSPMPADGSPVAVLPMRLSPDPFSDLVVLTSGRPAPLLAVTLQGGGYEVTSPGDEPDGDLEDGECATQPCENGKCSGPCTFRAALQQVQRDGGGMIMLKVDTVPGGNSLGPASVTLIGEQGSGTRIVGNNQQGIGLGSSGGPHTVQRLKIESWGTGLFLADGKVEESTFKGNRVALSLSSGQVDVEQCSFSENDWGISTSFGVSGEYHVLSNEFLNNGNGLLAILAQGRLEVQGKNRFEGNAPALAIEGGAGHSITGNDFVENCLGEDCLWKSPRIEDGGAMLAPAELAGCVVRLRHIAGATVQENTLESNGPGPSRIQGSSAQTAALCIVDSPQTSADSSLPAMVVGNTIINNEFSSTSSNATRFGCERGSCFSKIELIGNRIGVKGEGEPAGNRGGGVFSAAVSASSGVTIGPGNIIAHNQLTAGVLTQRYGDRAFPVVTQNSIHSNTNNFGVFRGFGFQAAVREVRDLEYDRRLGKVRGTVGWSRGEPPTDPSGPVTVEFFSSEGCDPPAGKTFLKSIPVNTDSNGLGQFDVPISLNLSEPALTATGTDGRGTGSFSQCATEVESEPIVVNSTADRELMEGADNCDTGSTITRTGTEEAECTLRAAIKLANQRQGTDAISFDVPETSLPLIRPRDGLPDISSPVIIDGSTQPVSGRIQLDGERAPGADGLSFLDHADGSTVRGLIITQFNRGISFAQDSDSHTIQGNQIGTDDTFADLGNGDGIFIRASQGHQIGGPGAGEGNLIAYNDHGIDTFSSGGDESGSVEETSSVRNVKIQGNRILYNTRGVSLFGTADSCTIGSANPDFPAACTGACNWIAGNTEEGILLIGIIDDDDERFDIPSNNRIAGNFIGSDETGKEAIPNQTGILLGIASRTAVEGNLISGNKFGIVLLDGVNSIENNAIGTDVSGQLPLPNETGVLSLTSDKNVLGGLNPADGNTVAFNTEAGVTILSTDLDDPDKFKGLVILGNRIFENGGTGVTLPRGCSTEPCAQPPVLSRATLSQGGSQPASNGDSSTITVQLEQKMTPRMNGVIVEFFANPFCDVSGRGEGTRLLGRMEETVPKSGTISKTFETLAPSSLVVPGDFITAITTVRYSDQGEIMSSEFSRCVEVRNDTDGDGQPDALESGDDNGNGVPDSEESDIVAIILGRLEDAERQRRIVVDSDGAALEDVAQVANPDPTTAPADHVPVFVINLVIPDFASAAGLARSTMPAQAGSHVVTLLLSDGLTADTYFNYGPTPDNPEPHWYEFLFDGATGAEILEDRILLHFVDGARGDHDLTVNGRIETLGGPFLRGETLYFPLYQADETSFTGFAVSNFGDQDALLEWTAFEPAGYVSGTERNPAYAALAPARQSARLGRQIFQLEPARSALSWVRLITSNSDVGSFLQFGTSTLSQLDGSVAWRAPAQRLYFTRVFEGPTAFRGRPAQTRLSVANPATQPVELTLTLEPGGRQAERRLLGKGFLFETISELFGEGLGDLPGHVLVEVTEGSGVVGFELIQLQDRETVIGLNAALSSEATEVFSAQLADSAALFTNLNLLNTAAQAREVTLAAVAEDGTDLSDPVTLNLAAGEQLSPDASELFGLGNQAALSSPAQQALVGSLQVVADGPGVIGDVIFGDPLDSAFAAALALQAETFTEAVFSQVANVPGFFTGLALYNPNLEGATLAIEVFAPDGTPMGENTQQLGAGQRLSRLVPELVSDSEGQAGGYIRIRSDQPLIAQQLFGTVSPSGITLLSAVPPTVVH